MPQEPTSKKSTQHSNGDQAEKPELVRVQLAEPEPTLSKRLITGDPIGQGGTAVIKRAFDANLLRYVAKKELLPENHDYEEHRSRLIEEAQITSQLGHPNIVPVHELSTDEDGNLFFTMKRVQGRTFTSILNESPVEKRTTKDLFSDLQILLKVCDALAFAHSKGVIHRDLKPDNIMVGPFGEVYLMDWGLAKLHKGLRPSKQETYVPASLMPSSDGRLLYAEEDEDGMLKGTLGYLAPEQARGDFEAIDERTDVFLLGGILFKILTHKAPYEIYGEENIYKVIYRAQHADIPEPETQVAGDLPSRLCQITQKALQKEQDDRYDSVLEFKQEIESFLQSGWQFERRHFAPGTPIVQEGDEGDTAYIITKGRCQVNKTFDGQTKVLAELSTGGVFGEMSVFTHEPRSATVVALDHVTAMEISRKDFEEDLGMSFWLGLFTKALAERYKEKEQRVNKLESALQKTD